MPPPLLSRLFASGGDETATSVETEPTEATEEGTENVQFQISDELLDTILSLLGSMGTSSEDETETTRTCTVTTNGGKLNVRTGVGLDNYAFTQLPNGTTVEVIGTDGDWYMIRLPEKIGYLSLSGDEWEHEKSPTPEKKPSIRERLEQGKQECNKQKAPPHKEKSVPEL